MPKFYICNKCNSVLELDGNADINLNCAEENFKELEAGVVEASLEKHIPVVAVDGDKVTVRVGSVEHPMTDAHLIEWIYLETEKGAQKKKLTSADKPYAEFILVNDKPKAVYAYCNLHGLWKSSL